MDPAAPAFAPTAAPAGPRPWTDVALAGLALAGLLDVAYLGVQEARGFEGGCTGFDPNVIAAPTSGCGQALSSSYSTLLGVSNVWLGGLFWGGMLLVGLVVLLRPAAAARLRTLRLLGLGAGSLYAAYLAFILLSGRSGGFCTFCFASHVLTFLSFGLALWAARRAAAPRLA